MAEPTPSSAPLKTAGEPFVALGECMADQICQHVAELPDRDSPADWPEAMLVTSEELRNIVLDAINDASQAVAAQAPAAVAVPTDIELRERWRAAGGSFHGPCVETGTMPEAQLLPFLRALAATPALPATEDSSASDLAESFGIDLGNGDSRVEFVLRKVQEAAQPTAVQAEPVAETLRSVFLVTQHHALNGKLKPVYGHTLFDVVSAHSTAEMAEVARAAAEEAYHAEFPGYRQYGTNPLRLWAVQKMDLSPQPAPQAQPADARDTVRLDWILRQGDEFSCYLIQDAPGDGDYLVTGMKSSGQRKDPRAAIDAAMAAAQEGGNAATGKDCAA